MKFNVLVSEVRAALLFASQDDSRYVLNSVAVEIQPKSNPLLIATDGRRLCVIQTAAPQEQAEFDAFTAQTIILAQHRLKAVCAFFKPDCKLFPLTIEPHGKRVVFQAPGTVVDCEEGATIEGDYPRFRQVLPSGEKEPVSRVGLNAEFVGDFAKAAKLLDPTKIPALLLNIFKSDGAMEAKIQGIPNFYGVIMPTRIEADDGQPEFLLND